MPLPNGLPSEEELLVQWEPKVQRMLQVLHYVDDRDDVAQEMRVAIIKAARGWRPDGGAIFHTYLHRAMLNTRATFLRKNYQRQPKTTPMPEDWTPPQLTMMMAEPWSIPPDILTEDEQDVVSLLIEGHNLRDIRKMGVKRSLIQSMQKKLQAQFPKDSS